MIVSDGHLLETKIKTRFNPVGDFVHKRDCVGKSIVLKLGSTHWVDLGLDRPGAWARLGKRKNQLEIWPGKTQSTRRVDPGPVRPG